MSTDLAIEMVQRSASVTDDDLARLRLDKALSEMAAEVAREPRAARRGSRRRLGRPGPRDFEPRLSRASMAVLLVIGLVVVAAAVPPVRAAVGELTDTLAGYFDGEDPPGRALESSDSAPAWLASEGYIGQRVLASSGPYALYLAHKPGGDYSFGLDDSVGIGDSAAGWERRFADDAVVVLGPGTRSDPSGRVPLYGVTAGSVAEVEMRYESGPASAAPAQTGGFVLMLDRTRIPAHLIARDENGAVLQVVPAHRYAAADPRPESRGIRRSPAEDRRGRPQIEVPAGAIHLDTGEEPRSRARSADE